MKKKGLIIEAIILFIVSIFSIIFVYNDHFLYKRPILRITSIKTETEKSETSKEKYYTQTIYGVIKNGKYKGYLTDFNFPTLMVTKPGFTFSDDTTLTNAKSYIGLVVDVDLNLKKETCRYVNSKGENVEVMNMFYPKSYGSIFEIDLETKVFTKK